MKTYFQEYDRIRFWLFTETYVASEIAKFLRQNYKIPPKMSSIEWRKRIIREHWNLINREIKRLENSVRLRVDKIDPGFLFIIIPKIEREIIPEIPRLASKLRLNEDLLRVFILYNNVPKKLYPPERVFFASPLNPITDMGYYIKIDEHLRERELLLLFKKTLQKIKMFSDSDGKKKTKYEQRRRKQFGKDEKAKILAFISVEKKIKENLKNNLNINYVEDKNCMDIVKFAIGGVVQDIFDRLKYSNEKQDKLFDRWQKRITTWYYTIADRYKLPTPKKLNSILRLMQS